MKNNRTGKNNEPPKIEDLGDGTYYYNFNVEHTQPKKLMTNEKYHNWDYDSVRLDMPVDEKEIQSAVDKAGF